MHSKGRNCRGECAYNCSISDLRVIELIANRAEFGTSYLKLGEMFGISKMHAHRIVNGKRRANGTGGVS